MERLEKYRAYIQKAIKEYASFGAPDEDIETQVVFDVNNDHYQLVNVGWRDEHRIYGNVLHIDIKGERIWIQYDGTETGIAYRLMELGVPKEDIVLAFYSPYKRQFTDFAVA